MIIRGFVEPKNSQVPGSLMMITHLAGSAITNKNELKGGCCSSFSHVDRSLVAGDSCNGFLLQSGSRALSQKFQRL